MTKQGPRAKIQVLHMPRRVGRANRFGALYADVHMWLAGAPDTAQGTCEALTEVARDEFAVQPKIRDVRYVLRRMIADGVALAVVEQGKAPVYRLRNMKYSGPVAQR
jgi:hypothetical protein